MVRDGRLELPTSCSQSKRATNCANPGFLVIEFWARCGQTCGQAVFLTTSTCGGSACIADVSRDCEHGIFRLEGGVTRSQTYVWTFRQNCVALFGTFRHSCGSSLELYWTVYFSHRFRLLGFVWDWILYIKSASDRVYLQQRVFLPQRVAQKLRRINNEISPGVTLPTLSTSEKCVVTAKTHS